MYLYALSASSLVLPLLPGSHIAWNTHTPDIIGIDPYFPAAMRQLRRDPVPRHYFSFLARDLGCPNSPSVSSRASTIPFPSPVAWRGVAWRRASRPWKFLQEPRTKGTNRRCSNDKQSHDASSRNRHWRASSSFPTEIWKGFVAKLKFKRRGRKGRNLWIDRYAYLISCPSRIFFIVAIKVEDKEFLFDAWKEEEKRSRVFGKRKKDIARLKN